MGAAFLLCWSAEAAEVDLPQGLSVAILALIAVLPEYAVDMYFAWTAGKDPSYTAYAAANMTGANRLLIGLGWASVLLAYSLRGYGRAIKLDRGVSPELVTLGASSVYACLLVWKSALSWVDFLLFSALFGAYAWRTASAEVHAPELEGPARSLGLLPPRWRRAAVAGLFLYSAAAICLAAKPFAEGLLATGKQMKIDEFLLVQWLAPIASEAPEFIVAILFALKGKGDVGMRVLLASKVNQWTLLVGMLPAAYGLSAGSLAPLPLDPRQAGELLLTAAQSIFALAVLINLRFSLKEALVLTVLFVTQPFFTSLHARHVYSVVYLAGTVVCLWPRGAREAARDAVRVALDFRSRS